MFLFWWSNCILQFCSVCLQPILIDARGHLLGRLAAIVAKTTLQGEFVALPHEEFVARKQKVTIKTL